MATPYIGEIRMFAGSFAPAGWAFCDGRLVAISENETLFNLIGTIYGGDGQQTFALPDLRGRAPVHQGATLGIGQLGGTEQVTLTTSQIPVHTHAAFGSTALATTPDPTGKVPASSTGATIFPYGLDAPATTLDPTSISAAGGSQPHDNMQPYLCVSFIIALFGVFPSPN